MDADRNIIPIVEGDQGEGFMDEIDSEEYLRAQMESNKPTYEELIQQTPKPGSPPPPPPSPMLMQVGMSIHFYGFEYKVIKLMKRGRLILKLIGILPDETKG